MRLICSSVNIIIISFVFVAPTLSKSSMKYLEPLLFRHKLGRLVFAGKLPGGDGFDGEAEGFDDRVVNRGTDFGDLMIFARGMDAVGEQHDEKLAVGVDPDAGAGEAGVAVAVRRKIVAAGAVFRGHDPAERACVLCEG